MMLQQTKLSLLFYSGNSMKQILFQPIRANTTSTTTCINLRTITSLSILTKPTASSFPLLLKQQPNRYSIQLNSFSTNSSSSTTTTTTTSKSTTKKSTGIVGLPVDPNAREKLKVLYKETLDEANKLKPTGLRDLVVKTATFRLTVVNDSSLDVEGIERVINCGQIEEILEQAQDELEMVKAISTLML
jgi:NADH dehydrogenase (ubiquinone) 1 alpha subcomplex subunit 5